MKKKWILGLAMAQSVTCLTACSSIDLPEPLKNFFGGSKEQAEIKVEDFIRVFSMIMSLSCLLVRNRFQKSKPSFTNLIV